MKNRKLSATKALFACAAILGLGAATANAAATIVIVNGNAAGVGFNDPTPAIPVGGNPGTTLGQQRLNAFQAAANIWGATLNSTVTIRILATFEPLNCTATSATLGSAGAFTVWRNFPGAIPNTLYPKALTNKMLGLDVDPDPADPDIRARFNSNLGNTGCLTGVFWYLGYDNNHGANIDLVTVLLHEFGHGLGFQTFTSGTSGAFLAGSPSIWDYFLYDNTANLFWTQMSNAQRVASAINSRKLVWRGANVTTAAPNALSLGVPRLVVSGPAAGGAASTYELGSASFGPLLTATGVSGDIMPIAGGVAAGDGCNAYSALDKLAANGNIALVNRGTCTFNIKAQNAQAAGAIGMIVQDNVAGSPPPGLGGTDPTITIPSGRVTLADGNIIRAALVRRSRTKSGVTGNLSVNAAQLAGADVNGFVQMFTPNPFQGGSSVSHYDTVAFPNLLMEPNINGDLTHTVVAPVDLTYSLLTDIGW